MSDFGEEDYPDDPFGEERSSEEEDEGDMPGEFKMEMGAIGEGGRLHIPGVMDLCTGVMDATKKGPVNNFINESYKIMEDLYGTEYGEDQKVAKMKEYFGTLCQSNIDFKENKIPEKNPLGMFLGFIASRSGVGLSSKSVEKAFNYLDSYSSEGVERPDVIRYGRFWVKLMGNRLSI